MTSLAQKITPSVTSASLPPAYVDIQSLYERHVPRYTSYPTAVEFADGDFNSPILANLSAQRKPISLYIHIPFCQSLCNYCGCNKRITQDKTKADIYLDYLANEIRQISTVTPSFTVSHIHYGGGSPSFLTPAQHTRLHALINEHFHLLTEVQQSIECDPRNLTPSYISHLANLGFRRLSLGIQDVNATVQQTINRVQSKAHIEECIYHAYASGFTSINLDLIVGLPEQTTRTIEETLRAVQRFDCERISVFNYAHLPARFPSQRKFEKANMPSISQKKAMTQQIAKGLNQLGYQKIGLDHFAKQDDSLSKALEAGTLSRNFQGYTSDNNDQILGLGVSAISNIGNTRSQNSVDLAKYYNQVTQSQLRHRGMSLSQDDLLRGQIISQLMCNFSVNLNDIARQFHLNLNTYMHDELKQLREFAQLGVLSLKANKITMNQEHRPLIRVIASVFDKYLQSHHSFSSVI
ncbi:MAG: oxygen-independent coproporphyrinogen III oxidase [Glaciecola sp.]|nr:oxygen-independent coproporphyrinogen III oxidase [Glaciecola sp.]MDG1814845.1 oxygen-independent coproporphyrinogen III oxidase [Glaciecola sp.]MDG2100434.1 oxygen-independent coproporphyrinogen III oxidase [Glaciecola sp.]